VKENKIILKYSMKKLNTTYLGLSLKSPLIVSSSRLTASIENLENAEKNGAGAVVLKSLFEEQINFDISAYPHTADYPEADDYMAYYIRKNSVGEYLDLIRSAKKRLGIPVIASINCYSSEGWTDFAKEIAESGADAIEINVFFMPVDRKKSAADSEKLYFELIEKLKKTISIPLSIKISYKFSNILYIIDQFYMRGVNGVVMFNRFYEPDIDTDRMEIVPAPIFSTEAEMRYVLRWIAMASAQDIRIDISASTGVQSGNDAVKYLLAGAASVQVCSVLYGKGMSYLKTMNRQIEDWMSAKGYNSISEFRGKLNMHNYDKPALFERTQFMKYFSSTD
jgi:dihydroorotate dehydrogenase (fumarate)